MFELVMGMGRITRMMGRRMLMRGRVGSLGGSGVLVIVVLLVLWWLWRRRTQTAEQPSARAIPVAPIDQDLAEQFSTLFYQIQTTRLEQDLETLAQHATPSGLHQLQTQITQWAHAGKTLHMDGLVIVDTQAGDGDVDHPKVVVTAQAKTYFTIASRTEQANAATRDDALITRFTEVWSLAYAEDGRLLLTNISAY
ncbi:TIM44-like domain-containing protein [Lacticaseibacillus porcinae]|uniref:TIM44-like domain-containing protein n=1 Tax=Lacticaseibacillus porcinae TaxID=1123687 RepID=UPI000F779946|nr:TIM44-like domain-containing protein [Lacticaseibacillus porcinae]